MKLRNLLLLVLSTLFFQLALGQLVSERDYPMSMGVKPAFVTPLALDSAKDAEKLWMDYLKDIGIKTKKNRKADEIYADDTNFSAIAGGESFDLYSRIEENNSKTEIIVWADLGTQFLNTENDKASSMSMIALLKEFEKLSRVEEQKQVLKEENKNLEKCNKDFDKLVSEKDKFEKDIKDAELLIEKRKSDIVTNLEEQEKQKVVISDQEGKVAEIEKKIEQIMSEK